MPSIDHEEGASRREKDGAQRVCLAEFKASEKIEKARTTAQVSAILLLSMVIILI